MSNTKIVISLSVVATVLVLGIGICIAINPLSAIGLAPVLTAISLIIRAIGDAPVDSSFKSIEATRADPQPMFGSGCFPDTTIPGPTHQAIPHHEDRERDKPWELGGGSLINEFGVGVVCESGVPPSEVVGEVVVEHSGADLRQ